MSSIQYSIHSFCIKIPFQLNVAQTSSDESSIAGEAESVDSDTTSEEENKPDGNQNKEVDGFARGLKPDVILGASIADGHIFFRIKWKKSDYAEWVTSEMARKECPQLVINYYEDHARWFSNESTDNSS